MLELRPNCELCDADLPPTSADARICSYECTYCAPCAEGVLANVCPTCGGGFAPRPIRPLQAWRPELKLGRTNHPPSERRRHSRWTREQIEMLVVKLKGVAPAER
jgi:hypothetical protein